MRCETKVRDGACRRDKRREEDNKGERERIKKDREGVMVTKSTDRGTNGWKRNEVNWKQEERENEKG